MPAWVDQLDPDQRQALVRQERPGFAPPMLATLTHETFSREGWLFERKLDGERCLALRRDGEVTLWSRNQKRLDPTYPEVAEALASGEGDLLLDGEVVAFEGRVTSFSRLQERMQVKDPAEARASGVAVYYYCFDLLSRDGLDLTGLPLRRRKALLRRALDWEDPLRFTPHRNRDGEAFHEEACAKGWEGIIAKRADSTYAHSRSRSWLKFKCGRRQELVVGGYTEPSGSRRGFGALLVGYYQGDDLVYAGKVGTGYDDETLERLAGRLASRRRQSSPFDQDDIPRRGVTWVRPDLVAEVGFTEWTHRGRLRHPRFLGLRRDKPAREVVREDTA